MESTLCGTEAGLRTSLVLGLNLVALRNSGGWQFECRFGSRSIFRSFASSSPYNQLKIRDCGCRAFIKYSVWL